MSATWIKGDYSPPGLPLGQLEGQAQGTFLVYVDGQIAVGGLGDAAFATKLGTLGGQLLGHLLEIVYPPSQVSHAGTLLVQEHANCR